MNNEMSNLLEISFEMLDVEVNTTTLFTAPIDSLNDNDKVVADLFATSLNDIIENGESSLPDTFLNDAEFLIETWLEDGLQYCEFTYPKDPAANGISYICKCNNVECKIIIRIHQSPLDYIDEVLMPYN